VDSIRKISNTKLQLPEPEMNPILLKKSFSLIADEGAFDPKFSQEMGRRLRDHIDSFAMAKMVIDGQFTNTPSLPEDSSNFDTKKLLSIMEDIQKQPVVAGITVKSQALLDAIERQTKPKPGEHEFMGFKFYVKEGQKDDCLVFYDAKLLMTYLRCDLKEVTS
jgi:hypothetical protein